MDSQELIVMTWIGLAMTVALLGFSIWTVISLRRKGRPVPPMISAQLLMILGGTSLGVSRLGGDTAQLMLAAAGGLLVAFAGGRMWDPMKRHLRDVGLIKPRTTDSTTGQSPDSQLNRAG